MNGREVVVGVTGGVAAYKTAALVSQLVQAGAGVTVVLTASAQRVHRRRHVRGPHRSRRQYRASFTSLIIRSARILIWPSAARFSAWRRRRPIFWPRPRTDWPTICSARSS